MPTFLTYPLAKEKSQKNYFALLTSLSERESTQNGSNRHLRANNPHKNQISWPMIKTHNKKPDLIFPWICRYLTKHNPPPNLWGTLQICRCFQIGMFQLGCIFMLRKGRSHGVGIVLQLGTGACAHVAIPSKQHDTLWTCSCSYIFRIVEALCAASMIHQLGCASGFQFPQLLDLGHSPLRGQWDNMF